jgi:hypothetical protein
MQWCAKKVGVLAEVLSPDVCPVRLSADRVNLLPTQLVGVDGAEEKKKLARLAQARLKFILVSDSDCAI